MLSSIGIDTVNVYATSSTPRSRSSTVSVDSSTIATATVLSCAFDTDPSRRQATAPEHALRRTHLPDTSADLTRNWLTTTAPPPFSRKGVTDVVMPVKAAASARSLQEEGEKVVPRQLGRAHSTSRVQQEEGRGLYGRGHRRAESHMPSRTSTRIRRSEEEEERESCERLDDERTLGWVTLSRGLSTNSSHRRSGLRERRHNVDSHKESDGRGGGREQIGSEGFGSDAVGEGDCVEGRKLRRKWPWDTFLRIMDKRLGKKGTV